MKILLGGHFSREAPILDGLLQLGVNYVLYVLDLLFNYRHLYDLLLLICDEDAFLRP